MLCSVSGYHPFCSFRYLFRLYLKHIGVDTSSTEHTGLQRKIPLSIGLPYDINHLHKYIRYRTISETLTLLLQLHTNQAKSKHSKEKSELYTNTVFQLNTITRTMCHYSYMCDSNARAPW